nr:MAG TPA: Meiotically up-regulated protein 113 [Caudoviricetes sp.]
MEQVYIFDFGDKLKIGYSTNVLKRLSTIESASGAKAKQTFSVDGTREIEQAAHYYLREYRIRGEYFNCDFETARKAVNGIIQGEIVIPPNAKHRDAKKKANAKWDSENMATLACKVKKDHADRFKAYCAEIGKTSNAVLRDCVLSCVDGESPQKPAGAAQGIDAILTQETFKAAQEAAQAAEETLSEFISRAVDTQAKRDKVMFAMRQKELTSAQAGV